MLGFTEAETRRLVEQVCHKHSASNIDYKTVIMDVGRWYNGYLFNEDSKERVYNPDMVLYFTKEFAKKGKYPREMIDVNVASDYGKIRKLFSIKNQKQNLNILDQLLNNEKVSSALIAQFSFEREFTSQDFISLLFYMGFVSITGARGSNLTFAIPNYVIKRLYLDFFMHIIKEENDVSFEVMEVSSIMEELAYENNITPFIGLVEKTLKSLSNRDSILLDEKHIKLLLVGFANLTDLYFIKSEPEIEKHYPDLMFLYRPPYMPNYQFVFELKYLKKSEESELEKQQSKLSSN